MAVDLSVVISTYNRCAMLAATIESLLAQQTSFGYEVVIVDNNSSDDTAAVIRRYPAVRYVFEPQQGVAYGRNAGIEAATARVVAFTDDDVVAAPDWIQQLVRTFVQKPGYGCIGGRVLPNWPSVPPAWLTAQQWSPLALLDYGVPQTLDESNPKCLVTANMAVRREVFETIGYFDPKYQKIKGLLCAGEDREIQERYWRAGGRCWFEPALVVYADIQPERLTKSYHRRWHYGHGQFNAMLAEPGEKAARFEVFGVPAHIWKRLTTESMATAGNYLLGRESEGFAHELNARFAAGFINRRTAKG